MWNIVWHWHADILWKSISYEPYIHKAAWSHNMPQHTVDNKPMTFSWPSKNTISCRSNGVHEAVNSLLGRLQTNQSTAPWTRLWRPSNQGLGRPVKSRKWRWLPLRESSPAALFQRFSCWWNIIIQPEYVVGNRPYKCMTCMNHITYIGYSSKSGTCYHGPFHALPRSDRRWGSGSGPRRGINPEPWQPWGFETWWSLDSFVQMNGRSKTQTGPKNTLSSFDDILAKKKMSTVHCHDILPLKDVAIKG